MKPQPFFPAILHGADYNPEQWPESVWDDDVALMKKAGVNVATLPVFGWVSLQPDEDTFTFEWLDRIIDKLHAHGIRVCLATATASVPAWMTQKYPDILRVEENGLRRKHGSRITFCPSSKNFQRLSTDLARRLAKRYGNHPALAVWHISNEYGHPCYCDQCAGEFRLWLKDRYGSLAEVNRRWLTTFWGHTYTNWEQIDTPTLNGERSMQSLLVDYNRFASHSMLKCYRAERDAVRAVNPAIPITTNLMGAFKAIDGHSWAREMDIVSWDSYPARGTKPSEIAFAHSLMRGLREGQPWMLMEQTPSQQNWQPYNALKRPGLMRLWSYQAVAHGADTVMYFQWRRSIGGCEKYHGAVVEHAGTSEARVFREVAALGAELQSLGSQTLGARVQTRAAVLFDWENWWALEFSAGPSIDLKYVPQCQAYYSALHDAGIVADVVSPDADLSGYALVVAPVLYMVKPGVAERLEKFVSAGGTLLTTYFSSIVDETDLVHPGGYPGPLRKLLGIWAEEIDVLSPQESNRLVFDSPLGALSGAYSCGLLCDRIHAEGARVLATYGDSFYAGEPALTENHFGQGRAYYLATFPEPAALGLLMRHLCTGQNITPTLGLAHPGIETVSRLSPSGETLHYVLNHTDHPVEIPLPAGPFLDLLTSQSHDSKLPLPPLGVAILKTLNSPT